MSARSGSSSEEDARERLTCAYQLSSPSAVSGDPRIAAHELKPQARSTLRARSRPPSRADQVATVCGEPLSPRNMTAGFGLRRNSSISGEWAIGRPLYEGLTLSSASRARPRRPPPPRRSTHGAAAGACRISYCRLLFHTASLVGRPRRTCLYLGPFPDMVLVLSRSCFDQVLVRHRGEDVLGPTSADALRAPAHSRPRLRSRRLRGREPPHEPEKVIVERGDGSRSARGEEA